MPKVISRQSNMELLRVISMILVMMIHADFYSIPYSIPRWFVVEGADAGVNCFVLISGYFGIRPKMKGLGTFLFQIMFFICIGNLIRYFGEGNNYISYNPLSLNWFINSYIALYVFAPVLNAFAEYSSKRNFQIFLILWATVEFLLGYVVDYLKFERGYSFQAFILLYMIARYIKMYGGKLFSFPKKVDLVLFAAFTILTAVFISVGEMAGKGLGAIYYFRAYNSSLMILASLYLMLFFTKLELQSKPVNWFGKSAFAAFLLHSVLFFWYRSIHHTFYLNNHWLVASLYSLVFILVLFTISILIDQIRIRVWESGIKCFEPLFSQVYNRFHKSSE